MATQYEIDITLPSATVDQLKTEGFSLYGFKAVKTQIKGAAPLVWFTANKLLTTVKVEWEEQYQAYISSDQIIADGVIDVSTAADIDLGQTAEISPTGVMSTDTGGVASAISIHNGGDTRWTAGISQLTNGQANPMCAIPLHCNMLDVVAPIEKVLLTFATNTVDTGTVIYKTYGPSILIDLTAAQTRAVSFDIDGGWTWDGGAWGREIAANADLIPILIS